MLALVHRKSPQLQKYPGLSFLYLDNRRSVGKSPPNWYTTVFRSETGKLEGDCRLDRILRLLPITAPSHVHRFSPALPSSSSQCRSCNHTSRTSTSFVSLRRNGNADVPSCRSELQLYGWPPDPLSHTVSSIAIKLPCQEYQSRRRSGLHRDPTLSVERRGHIFTRSEVQHA